jgi:endosialidase-like protein
MRLMRTSITIGTLFLAPLTVLAQVQSDAVPLKPWPAPLFWQPASAEIQMARDTVTEAAADTRPANSLVFVGMTPCRVADTRNGSGFSGAFGPPSLVGGAKRTFPIQSSPNCSIPAIAQAYSFNITIVPPGFVDFVTVGPTPVSTPPTFSTLNGYVCAFSASACVISNAAIVPAGTSGSVDVYASQNTNLIIDINGYYAAQTGITLAQGAAGTPSVSFNGDPGTGIYSSGAGTLNIATLGVNRFSVASNGDVSSTGSFISTGSLYSYNATRHFFYTDAGSTLKGFLGPGLNSDLSLISKRSGDWLRLGANGANVGFWVNGGADSDNNPQMVLTPNGLGIGTLAPLYRLHVEASGFEQTAIMAKAPNFGVRGEAANIGLYGKTTSGIGVEGDSPNGWGVLGTSTTGYAGYFQGNVYVTGSITQNSDARLKQDVASLGYGLRDLLRLRPVSFNWKDRPDRGRQLGLIAQEVEPVLPELVTTDKDAEQTKGLNYIGLVPVTIKAIQEQQAQIEDQKKRIADLEEEKLQQQEQNRKLEERVAAIEALLSSKAN